MNREVRISIIVHPLRHDKVNQKDVGRVQTYIRESSFMTLTGLSLHGRKNKGRFLTSWVRPMWVIYIESDSVITSTVIHETTIVTRSFITVPSETSGEIKGKVVTSEGSVKGQSYPFLKWLFESLSLISSRSYRIPGFLQKTHKQKQKEKKKFQV